MEIEAVAGSEARPNLPQELVSEILLRLPVKSLLKFRCVSKSWLSFISNPQFIKTHLERSKNIGKHARHNLLLSFSDDGSKIFCCSLPPLLYENSPVNAVELECLVQDPNSELFFVGCCNGLFCILEEPNNLTLWNPSTRNYKKLPDSGIDHGSYRCFAYGLGYDELHDDYKIVENCCSQGNDLPLEAKVSVYSLKSNSWRTLENRTGIVVVGGLGVFLNGALHFSVARHENSRIFWSIISFNIAEETFGEIPPPEQIAGSVGWSIGILEDCLSISFHAHETRTEVWILKEYNVNESWTKLFTVPWPHATSIITSDADELLLMSWREMIIYNPRDKTSKHCAIRGPGACTAALPYIESLIYPDQFGN